MVRQVDEWGITLDPPTKTAWRRRMMWGGGYGMSLAGIVWMVVMLAVLAVIVVGVVFLVRGLSGHRVEGGQAGYTQPPPSPGGPVSRRAVEVLEERYARGEIDREEFLQRRQDLLGG